ncbi:hypothetical protein Y032_0320g2391 [Ancylostoma ceylanicum]|uniref:Uncharacterized protein n=1 Tax=Ancylostoma ceylanicum TaxID=53326 RepID=A0A016S1Y5_9BILA|nr:hypothetical protein Y032_0320g2391 [Ancylostoma ceylanicum]
MMTIPTRAAASGQDHSATMSSQGTGLGLQDQQMLRHSPPPYMYPWQLGNFAPMNAACSLPVPCDNPYGLGGARAASPSTPPFNYDSLLNNIQLLASGRSAPELHGTSMRTAEDTLRRIYECIQHFRSPNSNAIGAHQNGLGNVSGIHQQPQQMGSSNNNGATVVQQNHNTEAIQTTGENPTSKSKKANAMRSH